MTPQKRLPCYYRATLQVCPCTLAPHPCACTVLRVHLLSICVWERSAAQHPVHVPACTSTRSCAPIAVQHAAGNTHGCRGSAPRSPQASPPGALWGGSAVRGPCSSRPGAGAGPGRARWGRAEPVGCQQPAPTPALPVGQVGLAACHRHFWEGRMREGWVPAPAGNGWAWSDPWALRSLGAEAVVGCTGDSLGRGPGTQEPPGELWGLEGAQGAGGCSPQTAPP